MMGNSALFKNPGQVTEIINVFPLQNEVDLA